jgi:predicted transcriptional regulator
MTELESKFLGAMASEPRNLQYFTNNFCGINLASANVKYRMKKMRESGLCSINGEVYSITQAGRLALERHNNPLFISGRICNASMREIYSGKDLTNPPARPGAGRHGESFGVRC